MQSAYTKQNLVRGAGQTRPQLVGTTAKRRANGAVVPIGTAASLRKHTALRIIVDQSTSSAQAVHTRVHNGPLSAATFQRQSV